MLMTNPIFICRFKINLASMGICLYSLTQHSHKKIDCCNFIMEKIRGIYIEVVTAESYVDDLTLVCKMR
jgi:hypothetical protein